MDVIVSANSFKDIFQATIIFLKDLTNGIIVELEGIIVVIVLVDSVVDVVGIGVVVTNEVLV